MIDADRINALIARLYAMIPPNVSVSMHGAIPVIEGLEVLRDGFAPGSNPSGFKTCWPYETPEAMIEAAEAYLAKWGMPREEPGEEE